MEQERGGQEEGVVVCPAGGRSGNMYTRGRSRGGGQSWRGGRYKKRVSEKAGLVGDDDTDDTVASPIKKGEGTQEAGNEKAGAN